MFAELESYLLIHIHNYESIQLFCDIQNLSVRSGCPVQLMMVKNTVSLVAMLPIDIRLFIYSEKVHRNSIGEKGGNDPNSFKLENFNLQMSIRLPKRR